MEELVTVRTLLWLVVFVYLGVVGARAGRIFDWREWAAEHSRVRVLLTTVFLDIDLPLLVLFGTPFGMALAGKTPGEYTLLSWVLLYEEMPEVAIGLLVPGIIGLGLGVLKMVWLVKAFQASPGGRYTLQSSE